MNHGSWCEGFSQTLKIILHLAWTATSPLR